MKKAYAYYLVCYFVQGHRMIKNILASNFQNFTKIFGDKMTIVTEQTADRISHDYKDTIDLRKK